MKTKNKHRKDNTNVTDDLMVNYSPMVEGIFANVVLTFASNCANSCVSERSGWGWNISVSLSRLSDGQASTSISHGRFLELVVKESGSFRRYWPEIRPIRRVLIGRICKCGPSQLLLEKLITMNNEIITDTVEANLALRLKILGEEIGDESHVLLRTAA